MANFGSRQPAYSPAVLRILRIALALPPAGLGLFAYWRSTQGLAQASEGTNLGLIAYVAYGFCAFAIAAIYGVRALRARAPQPTRPTFTIIAWALGEASALFGAIVLFLGGPPWPWVLGLIVIAFSWLHVPVDPAED